MKLTDRLKLFHLIITMATETNKMQSQMADFIPVPPPGKLDEIYASSLILTNTLQYEKT